MNWFVESLLTLMLEFIGAFTGYVSINHFKEKRYFWGVFWALLTIRVAAMVITASL